MEHRTRGPAATATAAGLALLLTACGTSGSAPTGASGTDEPGRAGVRLVEHALGTAEVPLEPERVVVLDTGELDATLALGVTPVGAVRATPDALLPEYIGQAGVDPGEIADVGTIAEPDLEAIAALEPDLILTNAVRHEDIYPQLDAIAPTVVAEDVGDSWKENFRLDAEALGLADEGRDLLAAYDRRTAEVAAAVGDPSSVEVSVVRFFGAGPVRLYGEGSFIGTVLADVGFARPQIQRTDETFVEVSPERIDAADGDLLVYAGYGEDGESTADAVTSSALWQGLDVVREGRAVAVDDDVWFLAIGPLGAGLVLDELAAVVDERLP